MKTFDDLIKDGKEKEKKNSPIFNFALFFLAALLGYLVLFPKKEVARKVYDDYEEVRTIVEMKTNFLPEKKVSLYFPKKRVTIKNCILQNLVENHQAQQIATILIPKREMPNVPILEQRVWVLPLSKTITLSKKTMGVFDESF